MIPTRRHRFWFRTFHYPRSSIPLELPDTATPDQVAQAAVAAAARLGVEGWVDDYNPTLTTIGYVYEGEYVDA